MDLRRSGDGEPSESNRRWRTARDPMTFDRRWSWTYRWQLHGWLTVALREEMERSREGGFLGENDFGKEKWLGLLLFNVRRFFNFFFFNKNKSHATSALMDD